MTIAQFKNELTEMLPQVRIKEMFFLHKTSRYYEAFEKVINAYYVIQYHEMNSNLSELLKIEPRYIQLYEEFEVSKANFNRSTGKAIVVFEEQSDKEFFAKELHMSQPKLILHNIGRMLKIDSVNQMGMHCGAVSEPGEVIWKYIGDSSIAKTKVRLETWAISIIFLVICYAVVFYPMD